MLRPCIPAAPDYANFYELKKFYLKKEQEIIISNFYKLEENIKNYEKIILKN